MYKNAIRRCAYCGNEGQLTNEHVFPAFITKISAQKKLTYMNGINHYFIDQPTIKDVCKTCNCGVLSHLDNYGKSLSETYFLKTINNNIRFEYYYDILLRWLLKIIYNGSRAFNISYSSLIPYIPYIIGKSANYPYKNLFACIIKPSKYNGKIINPNTISISELLITDRSFYDIALSRSFTYNSYLFIIIGWNQEPSKLLESKLIKNLFTKLGAMNISKADNKVDLNFQNAKIDYMSNRIFQSQVNPIQINDIEQIKKKVPDFEVFKIIQQQASDYTYSKVVIVTYEISNKAIPILGFIKNKIHSDFIKKSLDLHFYNDAVEYNKAIIEITRNVVKTYINIYDSNYIGLPYNRDLGGLYQNNTNWNMWKDAILNNNNFVYIACYPENLDYNKMKIVSKIKAIIK